MIGLTELHELLSKEGYRVTTGGSSKEAAAAAAYPLDEALQFLSSSTADHGCRELLDYHGVGDYSDLEALMMMPSPSDGAENISGDGNDDLSVSSFSSTVLNQLYSLLLETKSELNKLKAANPDDLYAADPEAKLLESLVRLVSVGRSSAAEEKNSDRFTSMHPNPLAHFLYNSNSNDQQHFAALRQYFSLAQSLSLTERYPHSVFLKNIYNPKCKLIENFSRIRVGEKKFYEVSMAAPFVDLVASAISSSSTAGVRKEEITVVDIGAGQGYLQLAIRDRGLHSLVAVERDSHQVDGAKERVGNNADNNNDDALKAKSKKTEGKESALAGATSVQAKTTTATPEVSPPSMSPMCVCFLEVNDETTSDSLKSAVASVGTTAATLPPRGYVHCNLHACGNLSMETLRLFSDWSLSQPEMPLATVNIGCCYNLIADHGDTAIKVRSHGEKTVIAEGNNNQQEVQPAVPGKTAPALPMSKTAASSWVAINKNNASTSAIPVLDQEQQLAAAPTLLTHKMKSTACQAPQRYSAELKGTGFGVDLSAHVQTLTTNFNRAAIENLLVEECGFSGSIGRLPKPGKAATATAGHTQQFVSYYTKVVASLQTKASAAKKKKLEEGGADEEKDEAATSSFTPLPEDRVAVWYTAERERMFLKTCAMWAVRAVGASAAEAALLVDRCHFVEERTGGQQRAYLVPIFDPVKSPRGFAVVALPVPKM